MSPQYKMYLGRGRRGQKSERRKRTDPQGPGRLCISTCGRKNSIAIFQGCGKRVADRAPPGTGSRPSTPCTFTYVGPLPPFAAGKQILSPQHLRGKEGKNLIAIFQGYERKGAVQAPPGTGSRSSTSCASTYLGLLPPSAVEVYLEERWQSSYFSARTSPAEQV